MMGKLQASTMPSSDTKDVIISTTESRCSCEPPDIKVVRINTHAPEPAEFEADQAISSRKTDNDKRRTVRLERIKLATSWGFTLQSYGIYNSTKRCIENYTYVDYVEMKSPAYIAGMKRGDIIFAVDGQSTDDLAHEDLVDKIKVCKSSMRMVLVNSNICQKVELHQRRQKLQALLRQKQSELSGLEKRETAIHINAKTRAHQRDMRRKQILTTDDQQEKVPENHYCSTLLVTENNNTVTTKVSPEKEDRHRDVRPKLSPVNHSIASKLPASTPRKLTTPSPSSATKTQSKSGTKSKSKHSSPKHSPQSKHSPSADKEARLRACMSKLALSDEPTAYERTLFAQSRQHDPPDNLSLKQTMDPQMYRSVRLSKSPTAADPMYRSMRVARASDKVSQD